MGGIAGMGGFEGMGGRPVEGGAMGFGGQPDPGGNLAGADGSGGDPEMGGEDDSPDADPVTADGGPSVTPPAPSGNGGETDDSCSQSPDGGSTPSVFWLLIVGLGLSRRHRERP